MLNYELVVPSEQQVKILYDLLNKRKHSVSHGDMPVWSDHEEFVRMNPYRVWYLIKRLECYVGTVYLTNENHVSISVPSSDYGTVAQVLSWIIQTHEPLEGIKSVRPDCYQINIPTTDISFTALLDDLGHKKVQVTYLLKHD